MRHTIEIATNSGGNIFRAYDKASGNTLWEVELEAGASGPPVSYLYEGKQYIVVAIGDREHFSRVLSNRGNPPQYRVVRLGVATTISCGPRSQFDSTLSTLRTCREPRASRLLLVKVCRSVHCDIPAKPVSNGRTPAPRQKLALR